MEEFYSLTNSGVNAAFMHLIKMEGARDRPNRRTENRWGLGEVLVLALRLLGWTRWRILTSGLTLAASSSLTVLLGLKRMVQSLQVLSTMFSGVLSWGPYAHTLMTPLLLSLA